MTHLLSPRDDQAVILLYHGVSQTTSWGIENFSGKHIDADIFEKQMEWIARNATPLSLREISDILLSGEMLPPRSVAVTFDDSYRNNCTTALPILKCHGVPATFFVNTGFVGSERRYWTDKVEHAINSAIETRLDLVLSKNGPLTMFNLSNSEWSY